MRVTKRNGDLEDVSFDKILRRLCSANDGTADDEACTTTPLSGIFDISIIGQKVVQSIYDGVSSEELDELSAQIAISMSTTHPQYSNLASRICVSNAHKRCRGMTYLDILRTIPNVDDSLVYAAHEYERIIDETLDLSFDYKFDYFGLKTLQKGYLLGKECPQHLFMRISLAMWTSWDTEKEEYKCNIVQALRVYDDLRNKRYIHATPTLFNSGIKNGQLSSCFLLTVDDNLESIFASALVDCARISKSCGGIGMDFANVRASGSKIKGTDGVSNGIVPFLRIFNETARAVNQGGKRLGSIAVYIEPWHPDIREFINLRKNHGAEEMRARDLFLGLWIPDEFMERVRDDETWSLVCPSDAPELHDLFGDAFVARFREIEEDGSLVRETVRARDLWEMIITSCMETGTPYMLFKDAVNHKSNQKHLGTIRHANLCTE